MANKTDFADQSAEARKKRMEMPADKYGKMVDKTMGTSKGGKKGDFNEEPDTAPTALDRLAAQKKLEYEAKYGNKSKKDRVLDMMEMGTRIMGGAPPRVLEKAKGGMVSSASKRADGCAVKGKTKGRMV